jgi:hypothetical protein
MANYEVIQTTFAADRGDFFHTSYDSSVWWTTCGDMMISFLSFARNLVMYHRHFHATKLYDCPFCICQTLVSKDVFIVQQERFEVPYPEYRVVYSIMIFLGVNSLIINI